MPQASAAAPIPTGVEFCRSDRSVRMVDLQPSGLPSVLAAPLTLICTASSEQLTEAATTVPPFNIPDLQGRVPVGAGN